MSSSFRYCSIDVVWPLKWCCLIGMAVLLTCLSQPSDICFDGNITGLMNAFPNDVFMNDKLVYDESKAYFISGKYCIKLYLIQHQFCKASNFTMIHQNLCLAQSREFTAIFTQLFLAIIIEAVHMIFLYRGIKFLMSTSIAIPILQVAMLFSVCTILGGIELRWPSQWSHAGFSPESIPSLPFEYWLICLCVIMVLTKIIETIALYRAFKRNNNGVPEILYSD